MNNGNDTSLFIIIGLSSHFEANKRIWAYIIVIEYTTIFIKP